MTRALTHLCTDTLVLPVTPALRMAAFFQRTCLPSFTSSTLGSMQKYHIAPDTSCVDPMWQHCTTTLSLTHIPCA